MRWIKASERLPDKAGEENKVIVRKFNGLFATYGFKTFADPPRLYFTLGSRSYTTSKEPLHDTFPAEWIEWLDETPLQDDYWKKRCEAAEAVIDASTDWREGGDGKSYQKLQAALKQLSEWQSLKNQPPTVIQEDEWVSVEDRLPKENERVLVCYINDYKKVWREVANYTHGGVEEFYDEDESFPECYDKEKDASFLPKGFWVNSEIDESRFLRLNVTHWRHLPKPPQ